MKLRGDDFYAGNDFSPRKAPGKKGTGEPRAAPRTEARITRPDRAPLPRGGWISAASRHHNLLPFTSQRNARARERGRGGRRGEKRKSVDVWRVSPGNPAIRHAGEPASYKTLGPRVSRSRGNISSWNKVSGRRGINDRRLDLLPLGTLSERSCHRCWPLPIATTQVTNASSRSACSD